MSIEAKLGLNTFKTDTERHIKINEEKCRVCRRKHCLYVCPAHLYTLDKQGNIEFKFEGCLECGTCRLACGNQAIDWNYPRGGFGVQYKFG